MVKRRLTEGGQNVVRRVSFAYSAGEGRHSSRRSRKEHTALRAKGFAGDMAGSIIFATSEGFFVGTASLRTAGLQMETAKSRERAISPGMAAFHGPHLA
jgi:DNA-binding transcriptional regulator LsrR (DeoR family)